jgi:two-component system LytT family response regulator
MENKSHIIAKQGNVFNVINFTNILYFEAEGNYTKVVFADSDNPLFIARKLKEVGILLPPYQFIRIHRSFIVNVNNIVSANYVKHGIKIMLKGEQHLTFGIKKRKEIMAMLEEVCIRV